MCISVHVLFMNRERRGEEKRGGGGKRSDKHVMEAKKNVSEKVSERERA